MNKKLFALSLTLFLLLSVTIVKAQINPTLTASPSNSHIFYVSAENLHLESDVDLNLLDADDVVIYTFVEEIVTDVEGAFTMKLVIVPTSIGGTYTLQATTTAIVDEVEVTLTAEVEYTVPDLTGSQGEKGDAGVTGATGATGATGEKGDTGVAGAIGANGTKGDTGAKGDKGDTGVAGATGSAGSIGAAGAKGADADNSVAYGALAIAIIAILAALGAYFKKR